MDDRPERLARFGKSAFPFEPVCRPLSRAQADADDRSAQPVESER